ncbi:MAG: PA0069 family radical SAM protein [Verrucomicrobiales bacterium]
MVVKRGAAINPANPFERFHVEEDPEAVEELRRIDPEWEPPAPKTAFFVDDTQTLITKNDSPDLSFDASLNPYRGCEHGCSYCYARKFHEFLGFSSGLDFETKIMVKPRAPGLLRAEMSRKSWKPIKLAMSGVTDCYQPVERKLRITRGCLEVLADFRNPVVVITKNHLVTRDVDVLAELARWQCGAVLISITTLDRDLAAAMEPRASGPAMRLRAIRTLADAGIPVGVSVSPIIPGLNDNEIAPILESARDAGAHFATYSLVRLQGTVADVFAEWLERNVSAAKKEAILSRIRESHGGRLGDTRPGVRMTGEGERAAQIGQLFRALSRRIGFEGVRPHVVSSHFRRREPGQLELEL